MKIILFRNGDQVLAETNVVEEAEKILREYTENGCSVWTDDGCTVELVEPLPDTAYIIWPMGGGG